MTTLLQKRPQKYKHECTLRYDNLTDIFTDLIDTGIFIKWRRKWHKFCTINESHPETKLHYLSSVAIEQEIMRQMIVFRYMIHPFSLFTLYWEFFMVFVYSYSAALHLFNISLLYNPKINTLDIMKFAGDLFFIADIIKIFFTGYYNSTKSKTVLRHSAIAKKYLLTYFFFDVAAVLHSYYLPIKWLTYPHQSEEYYKTENVFRFLGFLKVARINRFFKSLELYQQFKNFSSYRFKIVQAITVYVSILIWLYSMYFWFEDEDITTKKKENSYVVYFSATLSLLGIGYAANVQLEHLFDNFITVLFLIIGYIVHMFVFVTMMRVWHGFTNARSKNENLLQQFNEYMKFKRLPMYLREKVYVYFDFKFQHEFYNESYINWTISDILRQEILIFFTKHHIDNVEIFKDLPDEAILNIISQLQVEIFLPGDVIVKAGSKGKAMFFISCGTVTVTTLSGQEICHLEDGAHFGDIALILSEPRVTTVTAVTPCEILKLKKFSFFKAVEFYPDIVEKIRQDARNKLINSNR